MSKVLSWVMALDITHRMLRAGAARYPDCESPPQFANRIAAERHAPDHPAIKTGRMPPMGNRDHSETNALAAPHPCHGLGAAAAAQAKIVAEPEMAAFCNGEAAAKQDTRPATS